MSVTLPLQAGSDERPSVIRPTDGEAIRLGKTLLRSARHGAMAAIDAEGGRPLASRVGTATDTDGTPIILVSMLAAHTRAIIADPRCSILLGEPGKGDPLAYPRITVIANAEKLERASVGYDRAKRRFLNRNPKAKLYVDLGDFHLFRLEILEASLNGGFGKAYALKTDDLVSRSTMLDAIAQAEQSAVDHMNADHLDAIDLYARHFAGARTDGWKMTGIDVDGFDLACGDDVGRIFFDEPLATPGDMRARLVEMAKAARGS